MQLCHLHLFQSVIIPIHNGEPWINDCFKSIESQQAVDNLFIEISVFNDASSDATSTILQEWTQKIKLLNNFSIKISSNETNEPKGGKKYNFLHC